MAEHETLAAALAGFQTELPKLRKDETAKVRGEGKDGQPVNYQYGYADLAQVVETVMPVLGKHGLSFTATPTMVGNAFVLEYALLHASGEARTGVWPLPNPVQTKPQNLGSAITYARRYALMAVTGTFPDKEDDDGQKAAEVPPSYNAPQDAGREDRPRQQRGRGRQDERPRSDADVIEGLGRQQPAARKGQRQEQKTWTDEEVGAQHHKISTLELDKAVALYDWMAGKALHTRPIGDDPDLALTATDALAIRLSDVAVGPGCTIETLDRLKGIAEDRALLKVPVSETETLDEALAGVRAIRNAERLEDSDHARALREQAAASYGDS